MKDTREEEAVKARALAFVEQCCPVEQAGLADHEAQRLPISAIVPVKAKFVHV